MFEQTKVKVIAMERKSNNKIRFPEKDDLVPDNEFFYFMRGQKWEKIRLHDYAAIYRVPGLYELVVSDRLQCVSPEVLTNLLIETVQSNAVAPSELRVLDFGAGNGLVGEQLHQKGVGPIIGIDIVPEASEAAERDRPGIYTHYITEDICNLDQKTELLLKEFSPNCLVCVSAIDANHVFPAAFATAFNIIEDGGWVVFNRKKDLVDEADENEFTRMIARLKNEGKMKEIARIVYRHRYLMNGVSLQNIAIVGKKQRCFPLNNLPSK